jgi:carboxyl-terminal processing protease
MRDGWKKAGLIGLGTVLGVLLSLNFSAVAQREAKLPIPYEDLQLLSAVFGKIKSDYVEPVSDEKLIREAINGMVRGLDPHSDFLDADAFKELQVDTQGKFGGLGIEVGVEDGVIRVVSPIEDTPAFKAGIKSGDLIVKIDDTATAWFKRPPGSLRKSSTSPFSGPFAYSSRIDFARSLPVSSWNFRTRMKP